MLDTTEIALLLNLFAVVLIANALLVVAENSFALTPTALTVACVVNAESNCLIFTAVDCRLLEAETALTALPILFADAVITN